MGVLHLLAQGITLSHGFIFASAAPNIHAILLANAAVRT